MTYEKRPIKHMLSTNARFSCQGDIWTLVIILFNQLPAWLSNREGIGAVGISLCFWNNKIFLSHSGVFFYECCLSVLTMNIVDRSIA